MLVFQIIIKANPTEDGLWNSPLTCHDFMLSVFDNKVIGYAESLNALSYIHLYTARAHNEDFKLYWNHSSSSEKNTETLQHVTDSER